MKLERLIWGFIFSPISGLVAAAGFRNFAHALCNFIYYHPWNAAYMDSYISYCAYVSTIQKFVLPAWIIVWLICELRQQRRDINGSSRLLTHLLYGPLVTAVLMFVIVVCCDISMIQYSRWQIHRYIHSNASPFEDPSFNLHNNYRGFCGNGATANIAGLYGDIPVSEFNSKDPGIRARSLKAEIYVADWLNGDEGYTTMLNKAVQDPDPTVRKIAENLYAENPDLQR